MRNQRGDTIIEVMLATVIMAVIVMGAYALVNRASRINQVSSERSESANAMQFQAETLKAYRDSSDGEAGDVWAEDVVPAISTGTAEAKNCQNISNPSTPESDSAGLSFFFDQNLNHVSFADVDLTNGNVEPRYYIWVEAYWADVELTTADFFIHSCWQGPGGTGIQEASLIYRLTI